MEFPRPQLKRIEFSSSHLSGKNSKIKNEAGHAEAERGSDLSEAEIEAVVHVEENVYRHWTAAANKNFFIKINYRGKKRGHRPKSGYS